ncbi:MAG: BRCT domain-containing protein [Myxococcota bacterium]
MASIRGKKVVLTGVFSSLDRKDATKRLEALGVDVTSAVSSATDLLFAGEKAGSKLSRAEALGVPVHGEAELLETLATGRVPTGPSIEPPNPRASLDAPIVPAAARATENPSLVGRRFVVTGQIAGLDREEAKAALAALGAKVTDTVSSRTEYLVAGVNPGGAKLEEAERHGVPVLDQAQLARLLAGEPLDVVARED